MFTNFVPIPALTSKKSTSKITFRILVFPAEITAIIGHKFLISTFVSIILVIINLELYVLVTNYF